MENDKPDVEERLSVAISLTSNDELNALLSRLDAIVNTGNQTFGGGNVFDNVKQQIDTGGIGSFRLK